MGRPTNAVRAHRRIEFIRLLAAGHGWEAAAELSGFHPRAVLQALDQPEFRTVVAALLDGRAENVAVTIAPDDDRLAA